MTVIRPADRYAPAADLWIVGAYFNPAGYRTKPANYDAFLAPIRAGGLNGFVVECAFGDEPFVLPAGEGILHVRGGDVMWQKERLLNLALAELPASCRKVAWLDCDILFADPDWAARTSRLLEEFPVVQPFTDAVRLPRGARHHQGGGEEWPGFAAVCRGNPDRLTVGDFRLHGHTGFAWAARRELLAAHGLYDGCITGSADHLMAHAFCGDWDSPCIRRTFYGNRAHHRHFADWGRRVYSDVRARIGCTEGTVLHLWHGDTADRCYVDRNRELAGFDFDPASDLRPAAGGCWQWNSDKPGLHDWAARYFGLRKEDGRSLQTLENTHAG